MIEIFQVIAALNRLKQTVNELGSKIDYLSKSPSQQLGQKYMDNEAAAKALHVSLRTLAKMRADGSIKFSKVRHKVLYRASDLNEYLQKNCKR
ncbi:MAG TPA: helix-turn-helix domain-containing protein [Prolixibacteraceae bacterium]|jgi:excisionase family DNA binding protein